MAPIIHMESHHHQNHHSQWAPTDTRQARTGPGGPYVAHQQQQQQQQWPPGSQMHVNPMVLTRDFVDDVGFPAPVHGMGPSRSQQGALGRDLLGEGSFMGRGYSIKRCQGFVRCDMDIDAEVVGWVIGKNGSTIKDMKHKTGCNMWVDQRALKLTITGPDLSSVEHAAKSVDAYVAAAPIKAGAVAAAVTKTLDCPPHLLDVLGDRTTIARIVKESHAQVVVNKKIGRIIVRGDHRSVDVAYASVQATIHAALNGGLGLHVNTPDSLGSHAGGGYFSSGGGGGGMAGSMSPLEGMGRGGVSSTGGYILPSHVPDFHAIDGPTEFSGLGPWPRQQRQVPEMLPQHLSRQHHRDGRGSDTESEIETVSLGSRSIGARTPVSSTAGSPRVAMGSYNTSPALSGMASTPGRDWSLFSGGFGLGVAALQESSPSCASTPTTARTTPRVYFPEGIQALGGNNETALGCSASTSPGDDAQGDDFKEIDGSGKAVACVTTAATPSGVSGAHAPPPSPASTASGEARAAGPSGSYALDALPSLDGEDSDGGDEGEDVAGKVARLGKRLQAMGLGKYCPIFAENEVDLEALGLMSEKDLADIGIPKGPRLKILNAVGGRGAVSHTTTV